MGAYLPIPLVAALIAFIYGKSVGHKWIPAIITFVLTMGGAVCFKLLIKHPKLQGMVGAGQIAGLVVSALVIFFVFTLPAQKKAAQKEKEEEAQELFNEEDT